MYSENALRHFQNPKNNAELKDADAKGVAADPICGDVIKLFLKIDRGVIRQATFKTLGCGGSIAAGSVLTDLLRGKTLDQAGEIAPRLLAEALGGLPAIKMHCPELAVKALQTALQDYKARAGERAASNGLPG